jgi:hypothetical protein
MIQLLRRGGEFLRFQCIVSSESWYHHLPLSHAFSRCPGDSYCYRTHAQSACENVGARHLRLMQSEHVGTMADGKTANA